MDAYDEVMVSLGLEPSRPPKLKRGKELAECGTEAAARRHYRLREPVDARCKAAKNAADQVRKRASRSRKALAAG